MTTTLAPLTRVKILDLLEFVFIRATHYHVTMEFSAMVQIVVLVVLVVFTKDPLAQLEPNAPNSATKQRRLV